MFKYLYLILFEKGVFSRYFHSLGAERFGSARLLSPKPSFVGMGKRRQLVDLDADGGKQLISLDSEPKGYFELTDDQEWQQFRHFRNTPNIKAAGWLPFCWYQKKARQGVAPCAISQSCPCISQIFITLGDYSYI